MLLWLLANHSLPAGAVAEALLLHLDHHGAQLQADSHIGSGYSEGGLSSMSACTDIVPSKEESADILGRVWSAFADVIFSAARKAAQLVGQKKQVGKEKRPNSTLCNEAGEQAHHRAVLIWQTLQSMLKCRSWWWGHSVLKVMDIQDLVNHTAADQLASMAVAAVFVLGESSAFCQRAVTELEAMHVASAVGHVKEAIHLRVLLQSTSSSMQP
jgi:hypothetical protein